MEINYIKSHFQNEASTLKQNLNEIIFSITTFIQTQNIQKQKQIQKLSQNLCSSHNEISLLKNLVKTDEKQAQAQQRLTQDLEVANREKNNALEALDDFKHR